MLGEVVAKELSKSSESALLKSAKERMGDTPTDIRELNKPIGKELKEDKVYIDDNGKVYRMENDLLPNQTYEINGYEYETDDNGRIVYAEGKLHLKEHEGRLDIKDSMENIGKGDQKSTDDRGHLIGDQFGGSNGMENLIPQDANINRSDYRNFENQLAREVADGKDVRVKVEPLYDGDSHRPSAIAVSYSIDGIRNARIFPN